MANWISQISCPFNTSLDSSCDNMAILISNTNFSAIRTPSNCNYLWFFSIIYHLINPFTIMLEINNDKAFGISSCKLTIFVVPIDEINIALMVIKIGIFCSLTFIPGIFKPDKFKKTLTCTNSKPTFILIPCTGISSSLGRDSNFFLQECKHIGS